METKSSSWFSPQFVLGIIVITLGVLFTLDNFYIIEAHTYLRLWPALLIVWGASKIISPRNSSERFFGFLLAVVGALLLLSKLDILNVNIWNYWPLVLIFIGANILLNSKKRSMLVFDGQEQTDSDATFSHFVFMSGLKKQVSSQEFLGGELSAIMGGISIDLRQAKIKNDEAILDVFAFWGGVEIRVPDDWHVVVQAVPLLGGFEDKTLHPKSEVSKRLVIKGYAIMGGAEVKN